MLFMVSASCFINTSCTPDNSAHQKSIQDRDPAQSITPADQKIIDKYNQTSELLRSGKSDEFYKTLEKLLPEITQIQNKNEREKIQMNIYLLLNMNNEAYRLNESQLKENPTPARLSFRCHLMTLLNKDKNTLKQCYITSASAMKKALENLPKNDALYSYAEFAYFLEMYRAGNPEYKDKMKQSIDQMTDESIKSSATIAYEDVASNAK